MTVKPDIQPVWQKKRRVHGLVWIIPILVAAGASLYLRDYFEQRGKEITIELAHADGLKVGDTPVLHRGVAIGRVSEILLSRDQSTALVKVRLERHQDEFAKEGAEFWVVRPEISGTNFEGLGTLFSGPYIDSRPGSGSAREEFTGLSKPITPRRQGLELTVHIARVDHLDDHSSVFYRGMEVGDVRSVALGENGDRVEAHLVVWRRYSPLVRANSVFWTVSGFDVRGGLFSGLQLQFQSFKALLAGGIAFATPDKKIGAPARPGTDFALEKQPKDEWLNWAPKIAIKPRDSDSDDRVEPELKGAERAVARAK